MSPATLRVSVVYLRPGLHFERTVLLPAPATLGAAIEASRIRSQVAELAGCDLEVGVFGQRRTLADRLHDGDRVEIYRPLSIDPKEARRMRVKVQRRRRARNPAGAG
jgi:putative ubiquitin-RnfH superfamily antitoxin RatB of RatAB toxin-antitoxin module